MALLIPCSASLPKPTISKPVPKPAPFPPSTLALIPSKLPSFTSKPPKNPRSITLVPSSSSSFGDITFDFDDDELPEDSPWEGAVIYRRNASVTHVEYSTTLERLGLGKLSTGTSKSRASAMGIRLPTARSAKQGEQGGDGTPVLVSVDVTRRKRRLKLDGIVRTVLTLGCNRCGEPAPEGVFSNFSLLLTEDPIEDSDDEINIGVSYGEDKHKSSTGGSTKEEEDDEKEIDPDDRFYFPTEEKEIDISKPIRDLVHLEITVNAVCDASCKGLCLRCGTNLNKMRCNCSKEEVQDGKYGPLKNLRKQMQQK